MQDGLKRLIFNTRASRINELITSSRFKQIAIIKKFFNKYSINL